MLIFCDISLAYALFGFRKKETSQIVDNDSNVQPAPTFKTIPTSNFTHKQQKIYGWEYSNMQHLWSAIPMVLGQDIWVYWKRFVWFRFFKAKKRKIAKWCFTKVTTLRRKLFHFLNNEKNIKRFFLLPLLIWQCFGFHVHMLHSYKFLSKQTVSNSGKRLNKKTFYVLCLWVKGKDTMLPRAVEN